MLPSPTFRPHDRVISSAVRNTIAGRTSQGFGLFFLPGAKGRHTPQFRGGSPRTTPSKHGRWLNQAETAIRRFSRQSLGSTPDGEPSFSAEGNAGAGPRMNRDRVESHTVTVLDRKYVPSILRVMAGKPPANQNLGRNGVGRRGEPGLGRKVEDIT